MHEQASTFLEDPSIQDAPTDKKIAFLESKGLSQDDIQNLIGVSRNVDSTSSDAGTAPTTPPPPPPSESPQPSQPPIITYPEFLLHQNPPSPPIISASRILQLLTVTSTAAALSYTTARYLISPMTEQLSSSRHDLFSTALTQLEDLNAKLTSAVSVVPSSVSTPAAPAPSPSDDSDSSSSDEDPTELFHLDAATQTSPPPSRHQSLTSTSTSISTPLTPDPSAACASQTSRLQSLHSQLTSLVASTASVEHADDTLSRSTDELKTWLEGVAYSNIWSTNHSTNMYSAVAGVGGIPAARPVSDEDVIAKVKSEIRGIKGALLSARNFPVAASGTRGLRA